LEVLTALHTSLATTFNSCFQRNSYFVTLYVNAGMWSLMY